MANRPILHVEDDPVDVLNLQRAFTRCGIANALRAARHGEEALALLRGDSGPGAGRALRPGLILLDLNMPVMNGFELLAALKADPVLRVIPVVVLTTSAHDEDRRKSYELGAAGFVTKPFDFASLVQAMGVVDRYWTLCESP